MNKLFFAKTTFFTVLLGLSFGVSAEGEQSEGGGNPSGEAKAVFFDMTSNAHAQEMLDWLTKKFEKISGGLRGQFEKFCKDFKTYAETVNENRGKDQAVVAGLQTQLNNLQGELNTLKGQAKTSFSDDAWKFFFDGNGKWATGAVITVATGYAVYKFFFQNSKSKNGEEEDFEDEE